MNIHQNQNVFYPFMKAVRGNWHNAMYLPCRYCTCTQKPHCEGFLMTADADGQLLLAPIEEIRSLTGEDIEPGDCLGVLEKRVFETLYSLYLEWHTLSSSGCPLLQLYQSAPNNRR